MQSDDGVVFVLFLLEIKVKENFYLRTFSLFFSYFSLDEYQINYYIHTATTVD